MNTEDNELFYTTADVLISVSQSRTMLLSAEEADDILSSTIMRLSPKFPLNVCLCCFIVHVCSYFFFILIFRFNRKVLNYCMFWLQIVVSRNKNAIYVFQNSCLLFVVSFFTVENQKRVVEGDGVHRLCHDIRIVCNLEEASERDKHLNNFVSVLGKLMHRTCKKTQTHKHKNITHSIFFSFLAFMYCLSPLTVRNQKDEIQTTCLAAIRASNDPMLRVALESLMDDMKGPDLYGKFFLVILNSQF